MPARVRLSFIVSTTLSACIMLSGTDRAWAIPISYVESVSGELAGQNLGVFDIGSNTVTGSEAFAPFGSIDRFLFDIPVGLQLDRIVLSSYTSGGSQAVTLAPPGGATWRPGTGSWF